MNDFGGARKEADETTSSVLQPPNPAVVGDFTERGREVARTAINKLEVDNL